MIAPARPESLVITICFAFTNVWLMKINEFCFCGRTLSPHLYNQVRSTMNTRYDVWMQIEPGSSWTAFVLGNWAAIVAATEVRAAFQEADKSLHPRVNANGHH